MNAQIRLNLDTGATEIFTGDKWVATYVQADIDKLQAEIEALKADKLEYAKLCWRLTKAQLV